MNGLDLFTGIGGITLGLSRWVRPVAYCEIEPYAQAVIIDRIKSGDIPDAPIWDDIRTLDGAELRSAGIAEIDIIYGGFPCQDISLAGAGRGLAGERSGLFYEIVRLIRELRPRFVFLENVAAITFRGLGTVAGEITDCGYDCRWKMLSAAEVGAPHVRNRFWLLANTESLGRRSRVRGSAANPAQSPAFNSGIPSDADCGQYMRPVEIDERGREAESFWKIEPAVGRVADGIPFRVDRIKGLGNAVVPACVERAFQELAGMS